MIQLSQASFLDLARRFASAEEFARWLIDNKVSLRAEREARRAQGGQQRSAEPEQVGLVESGLRVVSRTQADAVAVPPASSSPVSAEGLLQPRVRLAVARKAVPWLDVPGNAKAVMAALLDFCGEASRCGVGLDFIAKRLGRGGVDPRRNIRRGIADLVAAGLLKVAAHAGMRHVNVYFPQWDRLAAVVAAFESGAGVRIQSDRGDNSVLQSQKKNPTSVKPRRVQRAGHPEAAGAARARGREADPDRRQGSLRLMRTFDGGRAVPAPAGMPREQAGLRVMQAINRQRLASQIRADMTPELFEAAISAEVNRREGGIEMILEAMGPGPPGPMPEVSEALQARLRRG